MDRTAAKMTLQAAAIWIATASLAFLAWRLREAILVTFGAVLVAILFRALMGLFARWMRLREGGALAAAVFVVLALLSLAAWLFASRLAAEFSNVLELGHEALDKIKTVLAANGMAGMVGTLTHAGGSTVGRSIEFSLTTGSHILEGVLILLISALYLAVNPAWYMSGIIGMFARRWQPIASGVLDAVHEALRRWLLGELLLMVLVGALSCAALLLIGVPSPIALALVAAIAEMVPYVGPFLAAIPAVLTALAVGWTTALWALAAYIAIHGFEGYVVGPQIQRRFVHIPPALILLGMVAAALIFGPVGVIFATPLTVAMFAAVTSLRRQGGAPAEIG